MTTVEKQNFGKALNLLTNKIEQVDRYLIKNTNQMTIAILNRGATIQSIQCPDKYGKITDICLGFDNIEDYILHKNYYLGATLGRVANRISNGLYEMDGQFVPVTKNYQDKYQLNGGFNGFDSMIWDFHKSIENGIMLRHVNPDCHEGHPGKLTTTVTFTLDDLNCFRIFIEAYSTKTTAVNITNNILLNLAGHGARKEGIGYHNIIIKANKIVDTERDHLPNGCIMPVKHTPYDLRKYTNLGKRLSKFLNFPINGFDHCYCLCENRSCNDYVAKIINPCSGRYLEVYTNQPGLHFYTANNFPDISEALKGKGNVIYERHGAFCFQPERYPDSMNHSNFPEVCLQPKELYCHDTTFKFGVC